MFWSLIKKYQTCKKEGTCNPQTRKICQQNQEWQRLGNEQRYLNSCYKYINCVQGFEEKDERSEERNGKKKFKRTKCNF